MKNRSNLMKGLGIILVAGIALAIMCVALMDDGWFQAMMFIAPILSFLLTSLYSFKRNFKFTIGSFSLILLMQVALSVGIFVEEGPWWLMPGLAMMFGAIVVAGNLLYGGFVIGNPDRQIKI